MLCFPYLEPNPAKCFRFFCFNFNSNYEHFCPPASERPWHLQDPSPPDRYGKSVKAECLKLFLLVLEMVS